MREWALVDKNTNIIVRICAWDGETNWTPVETNVKLIECTGNQLAEIGGKYIDGEFVLPLPPPLTEPAPDLSQLSENNEDKTEPTVI
jgi:hypothetical protein